jgi:hypothetical protein
MVAGPCHLGTTVKRLLAAVLFLTGVTSVVDASPLSDALARKSDKDVAALRTNLADPATRCTLGAVYAQRNDLSRAALYLGGCEDAELPVDISASIAKIDRDFKKRLRDSDLSMIEVVTDPAGMAATIEALPGDTFTTPATLYLPAGSHKVQASKDGLVLTNIVHVVKRSRGAVVLEAAGHVVNPQPKQPKTKNIDMAENGGAADDTHSGPPPAVKHPNMMSEKYQLGVNAVATTDNPNALEDPMVLREPVRVPRTYWLGVRLGGGMFDDGASAARAGVAFAATGRFTLAGPTFLAGRVDWTRRGGEGQTSVDVVGVSAGAGMTVVDHQAIAIALLAQVRGDLRLASSRTMASMADVPVNRTGAAVAAGVELALPRSPFTAGVRF